MRISYVLGYLAARYGGPPYSAISVAKHMKGRGCDISFWATGNDESRADIKESGIKANLFEVSFPKQWFRSRNLYKNLSSKASSFDLFHMHGMWNYPVYAGASVASKFDIPYIISPHGALQPWAIKRRSVKKSIYSMLLLKKMLDRTACLHACSTQEAESFRRVGYRGPISIIPNGVDTDEFHLGNGTEAETYWPCLEDRLVVVFMSRLSPEKGLDILIPAWAELVKMAAYKDAILVIAGPSDRGYGKVVEAMIERYNIDSNICLTGMVRGVKKSSLLKSADVFVLPSYSENFGIVVAEALACATPVITTTGTPWQQLEKVGAGRWILPNKSELHQVIREFLDMSASQRNTMGCRGRELIDEKYNWDAIAQQYLIVYNCILKGKEIPLYPAAAVQKENHEHYRIA